jgi:excisionase family DNA binding protein
LTIDEIKQEWITVSEAAKLLGVSRPTIYRWAKDKKFNIYKLAGGVARIKVEELKKFLDSAKPLYE